jgi:hypothetical protein
MTSRTNGGVRALTAVGVLLLSLAVAFLVAATLIGSHVDESGLLHEPLIPLAWLAGLTGTALIAVAVWRGRTGRH